MPGMFSDWSRDQAGLLINGIEQTIGDGSTGDSAPSPTLLALEGKNNTRQPPEQDNENMVELSLGD